MNLLKSFGTASLPFVLVACSAPWSSPAPNGEAILKAEKARESAFVEKSRTAASPSQFEKDATKTCAGEICVDASFPHFLSGSVVRQLSCSSMGASDFLATVPESVTDGRIMEDILPKCDRLALVAIDETSKNLKLTERNGKWGRFEEVSKIPGGYAVFSKNSWCGGVKWSQKILSESGTEIMALPKSETVAAYPQTIKVWLKEFKAQDLSANEQTLYLGTFAKTVEFPKILSVSEDVSAEFEKYVLERAFLAESYLFTFKEYPGLRVKYLTKTTPSERIVFLGDEKRVKKIVQDVTDSLLEPKLTERILKEYDPAKSNRVLIPLGTSKQKSLLPAAAYDQTLRVVPFRVDRFDAKGNFLLYSNTDYEFETFWDVCETGLDDGYRNRMQ